jgi:hypothetical protein
MDPQAKEASIRPLVNSCNKKWIRAVLGVLETLSLGVDFNSKTQRLEASKNSVTAASNAF